MGATCWGPPFWWWPVGCVLCRVMANDKGVGVQVGWCEECHSKGVLARVVKWATVPHGVCVSCAEPEGKAA
jgi:hypothetical protein